MEIHICENILVNKFKTKNVDSYLCVYVLNPNFFLPLNPVQIDLMENRTQEELDPVEENLRKQIKEEKTA